MTRVTLRDVAERAGVSRATASLVLRGQGRVSEETRERVMGVMRDMGYVYDRVAASLRNQRAGVVGVVITNLANPFFAELFKGLEGALLTSGFVPLLASTSDDAVQQDSVLQMLREHRVDGLAIVPATGSDERLLDRLTTWGVGHLLVTRYVEGGAAAYLGPDDARGGALAAEHLIGHGVRKLAYVGGPAAMASRRDRLAGFRAVAQAAGIPAEDIIDLPAETTGAGGRAAGEALFRRYPDIPEGILCHSDSVAFGLFRALHDHGRTDVRVIGYDDIANAALWEPPLTSVSTGARDLGRQAAELLLARMEHPHAPVTKTLVEPTLVVRRSCGCQPS